MVAVMPKGMGWPDDDGLALAQAGGGEGIVDGTDAEDGVVAALRGGEDGGGGGRGSRVWVVSGGAVLSPSSSTLWPGSTPGPARLLQLLGHVVGGEEMAIAEDQGKARSAGDLMLAKNSERLLRLWPPLRKHADGSRAGAVWLAAWVAGTAGCGAGCSGVAAALSMGRLAAMESASARALRCCSVRCPAPGGCCSPACA